MELKGAFMFVLLLVQDVLQLIINLIHVCMASQPLKSTLRNLLFFLEGLPSSNKTSSYPVRMENGVPVVQQNQSTQPLQIQPSMLTQVRHKAHCL